MGVVEEQYLVCTDFERNANKFVHLSLYDDGTVTSRWGRVGVTEQTTSWNFGDDAKKKFDRKVADKLKIKSGRDAYTRVEILTSQSVTPSSNLESVATRDIDVDSETTRDLIRWLTTVNVHNIVSSTTMTYNKTKDVFQTPLGVVGKTMVDRARVLLDEMIPLIQAKSYGEATLKRLASEYLRIIPQDLGASNQKIKLETIFSDDALKKQGDILDALDASIISVLTGPQSDSKLNKAGETPSRVFDVKLHMCNDQEQRDTVEKLFNHTRKREHTSYGYEFKNLYTVDIVHMRDAWDKDGAKLDNRMRLWHGTSAANVLSILKVGLIIPKSCTHGWNYGKGIYFSDQSTKSLNYASGFWTGKDEGNRILMFLADVGMGKYFIPKSSGTDWPSGYDSCFAEGGKSGVANHEMIVPRVSMSNLVYLAEFYQ
jgi:poly [ADP-ribose] polymerase